MHAEKKIKIDAEGEKEGECCEGHGGHGHGHGGHGGCGCGGGCCCCGGGRWKGWVGGILLGILLSVVGGMLFCKHQCGKSYHHGMMGHGAACCMDKAPMTPPPAK